MPDRETLLEMCNRNTEIVYYLESLLKLMVYEKADVDEWNIINDMLYRYDRKQCKLDELYNKYRAEDETDPYFYLACRNGEAITVF